MMYSPLVQEAMKAGYTLDQIKAGALDEYNQNIAAGADRNEVRAYLQQEYGLSTGTTQEDLDDATFTAQVMFQDLTPASTMPSSKPAAQPKVEQVDSLGDALQAGYQNSVVGLLLRNEMPSLAASEDSSTLQKFLAMTAQGIGDMPALVAGGLAGSAAGAATGVVPGAVIGAGAGAVFTTEYLRSALVQSYAKGQATNLLEFVDRLTTNFIAGGKGAIVGATAAATGPAVAPAVAAAAAKILAPALVPAIAKGLTLSAEAAVMTTAMSTMEGKVPTAEDFILAGASLGAFKATSLYVKKFADTYVKTGDTPADVATKSIVDPTIKERVASINQRITETVDTKYYRGYPALSEADISRRQFGQDGRTYTTKDLDAARAEHPIDPAEYTGQWIYENKYTAARKAHEARSASGAGGSDIPRAALVDEVQVPKVPHLIIFKGASDRVMAKVMREFAGTEDGRKALEAMDPEFFAENPKWFEDFSTKLDERIVPMGRQFFNSPTPEFIQFLQTNKFTPDMVSKLSGGRIKPASDTNVQWAGIRFTGQGAEGSRLFLFNKQYIKPATNRPSGDMAYDSARAELQKTVSIGERSYRTLGEIFNSFLFHVVDYKRPLNTMATTGKVSKPYEEAILSSGFAGIATTMIETGMLRYSSEGGPVSSRVVGKSLKDILEPISIKDGQLTEFSEFLAARATMEQFNRGEKVYIEPEVAQSILNGPKAKEYTKAAEELNGYYKQLLQYQLDSGILSKRQFDRLNSMYKEGVPLEKMVEAFEPVLQQETVRTAEVMGRAVDKNKPIGEQALALFGIAKEKNGKVLVDPVESVISATFLTTRLAAQNASRREAAKLYGIPANKADTSASSAYTTISYTERGKTRSAAVPKDIARAVNEMDPGTMQMYNVVMRGMAKATGVFRVGTVMPLEFGVKNVFIDQFSAWMQSPKDAPFTPFVDAARGFAEILKSKFGGKPNMYDDWLVNGGGQASIVAMHRDFPQLMIKELTKVPVQNMIKDPRKHYKDFLNLLNPWNQLKGVYKGLESFAEYTDASTRVGAYMKAVKAGYSEKDAAFIARGVTIDFARSGASVKALNSICAFLNAGLQGQARIVEMVKADPVGVMSNLVTGVIIPSALLSLVQNDIIASNRNPEDPLYDQAEQLRQTPAWERNAYWTIPVPGLASIRIPKPMEYGLMAGPVESYINWLYEQDGPKNYLEQMQADGLFGSIADKMVPSVIPTVMVAPGEVLTNYSIFTGNKLIPTFMENQLPVTQYRPGTSTLAKWTSEQLLKLDPLIGTNELGRFASPIGIDHLIRGWSGSLGVQLADVLSSALEASGTYTGPVRPEKTLAEMPFFKIFLRKYNTAGAHDIEQFNTEAASLEKRFASMMQLAKNGDPNSIRLMEQLEQTGAYARLDGVRTAMGNMSQVVQLIYANENDPVVKRQQIENIYIDMAKVAKQGRQMVTDIKKSFEE